MSSSLFCMVDECTTELKQHGNARLHPSEILTLALLKRMTGKAYWLFLVWLKTTGLFTNVPYLIRLCRFFLPIQGSDLCFFQAIGHFTGSRCGSGFRAMWRKSRRQQTWVGKNKSESRLAVGWRLLLSLQFDHTMKICVHFPFDSAIIAAI